MSLFNGYGYTFFTDDFPELLELLKKILHPDGITIVQNVSYIFIGIILQPFTNVLEAPFLLYREKITAKPNFAVKLTTNQGERKQKRLDAALLAECKELLDWITEHYNEEHLGTWLLYDTKYKY